MMIGSTMSKRQFRGMTLVELMIAMAIGLVLTVVIAQLFLGSKQAFNTTDSLSRVQENARYALSLLSRELHSSTFRSDPRTLPFGATGAYPSTAPALTGTDGGTTGTPASGLPDTVTIRFQGSGNGVGTPDGTIQDCVGNQIDYNAMVVSTFFIQPDANNNNEPTLFCHTANPTCTASSCTPCAAPTCIPMVPSVENMQLLYSEDITFDPSLPAARWVTAANVGNWDKVQGVRISLLLRTNNGVNTGIDSKTYSMGGTNVNAPGTDSRMRRVFTTVVDLRNRTP